MQLNQYPDAYVHWAVMQLTPALLDYVLAQPPLIARRLRCCASVTVRDCAGIRIRIWWGASVTYPAGWQELFDSTTYPGSGASGTGEARMSLASLAGTEPDTSSGTSGGGVAKLNHSSGPWTSASGTAGSARTGTEKSRSGLGPGHEGVAAGAAGFTSVTSLKSVLKSWEERLTAVRDECDYLEVALLKVAKEMGETDTGVEKSFNAVRKAGEHR